MNVQWGNSKDEIRGARYEIRSTSYKVLQFNTICVYILSKKNGSLSAVGTLFFDFSKGTEMRRFQHDKPK